MKPFLSSPLWDAAQPEFWEAWQLRRLREFLKHRVLPFSAHYRRLFADHGLNPDDIRTWDDWRRVPFTDKHDLDVPREQLRDFVLQPSQQVLMREPKVLLDALLHGRAHARETLEAEFRPVLLTSTTGRSAGPVPFVFTKRDLAHLEVAGRRIMEVGRSDRSYRHVNLFPYAPHLAFWQAHYAGLGFGTFMLSTGGGKALGTDGNIALIERTKPDVLIGMPTFIYHVLLQAVAEKRQWRDIKRVVLGGEKVPPGLRGKLRSLCSQLGSLGVHVISIYGFTEAKMAFSECPTMPHEGPSGFHAYPDLARLEIINPQTGDPVPPGAPGEIVFTPLDARGTVVLRYRTGDIAEGGLMWDPCPHCGRRCSRIIGPISRVSERRLLNLEKLKGTLVDFNLLEHLLDDQRGVAAWQIELRKHNDDPLECDEVILHLTAESGISEGLIREQVARRLQDATELRPNAIFFHTLPHMREQLGIGRLLKEERIADHRTKIPATSQPPAMSNLEEPSLT
ncbi:MAG TPA: AMP-binding protein [Verrucomicrobiaceae bacterium]|jgi:phenylacetate-coenzyme A ligase PaaK-like adenylate-forming protein